MSKKDEVVIFAEPTKDELLKKADLCNGGILAFLAVIFAIIAHIYVNFDTLSGTKMFVAFIGIVACVAAMGLIFRFQRSIYKQLRRFQ